MVAITTDELESLHWVAVALALITGVIHLVIAIPHIPNPLGISFLLAGLGFLGWIALFLLGWRRPLLYLLGIPYVALQIVLYVALNWPDIFGPVGVADKFVQIVLIAVLVILYRRT